MGIIPPVVPPNDTTDTQTVTISTEWVSIILGLLEPLTYPDWWDGTETQKEQASEWVDELIELLMVGDA